MATTSGLRRVLPPQDPYWEERYQRFLRATGDADEAADLTQKAQFRLLLWVSRYGPPRSPEGLVRVACASVLADWFRAKQRRREVRILDDEDGPEPEDDAPTPEESAYRGRWCAAVREELGRCIRHERTRAFLTTLDEPVKSVAQALRTAPGRVVSARYKLKQRLRRNSVLRQLLQTAPGG